MHYHRWYRHGDPHAVRSLLDRRRSSSGYWLVSRPGHSLANARGEVYEHRLVLFESIGPGEHSCHWCGAPVSWELTYPESIAALVVDHLDDDKLNNERTNLVPSCNPCNGGRAATARHAAARA